MYIDTILYPIITHLQCLDMNGVDGRGLTYFIQVDEQLGDTLELLYGGFHQWGGTPKWLVYHGKPYRTG